MANRTNKTVENLRKYIGTEFSESPSPFGRWLNTILVEVNEGALVCDFTIRPEMANPANMLHGGVIAGIIDDMIGASVFTLEKAFFFSTINISVDYFASSQIGDVITAKTRVVKMGREIINVECELWNMKKKRLIARGNSNLMKTKLKLNIKTKK